jgi:two-component system sensor histidine kinase UhpB
MDAGLLEACFRCPAMRALEYIREPRRLPLGWRAGLANAAVFAIVFVLFIVTPVTVHAPPRLTEVVVLAAGLGAMLVVNLLLLRVALSPLRELAGQMERIDLRDPGRRLSGSEAYGPALTAFVDTFTALVVRRGVEGRAGARAALTAQERERLRIGRALHDEAGQTLTAIALEAERAASEAPPAQREQMAALAAQLHASLDEIRRISRDLRPEALDDLGLINALIALTSRADRQSGIRIERRLGPLPDLPSELELVIYRVAQEAVTNVLRHAHASQCVIALESSDGEVELSVRDDGVGMSASDATTDTIGIEGMRERALLANGTLAIESRPGEGTQVTLRLPIEAR